MRFPVLGCFSVIHVFVGSVGLSVYVIESIVFSVVVRIGHGADVPSGVVCCLCQQYQGLVVGSNFSLKQVYFNIFKSDTLYPWTLTTACDLIENRITLKWTNLSHQACDSQFLEAQLYGRGIA